MTTTPGAPIRKKLIEVSIPLEDINTESAREKSIRHGHPSTLHLWWARRPLAAARAVLFAQLVDDPSSDPELTGEQQKAERERLHGIIRRLVKWENINDESLLREAHEEILRSTGGNPPAILDPFAGGGTIPLEAQRLGLEAHASDLNPVAVLINKALIEIPPKFAGQSPVFPGAADTKLGAWPRTTGLAEDVRRYGAWMREQAKERVGYLYPDVTSTDASSGARTHHTVIAWLWARTVPCPNPGCGMTMPLVRSWWLAKKASKGTYVVPSLVDDPSAPGGRRIEFSIASDPKHAPSGGTDGTMDRGTARCLACGFPAPATYIREHARTNGLGAQLMAIVGEGRRERLYFAPSGDHVEASFVARPTGTPDQRVTTPNHDVDRLPMYGMPRWSDAFTNRQLTILTTLGDLVASVRERVLEDALTWGMPAGERLSRGGVDANAYADAIATYLGLAASRTTDYSASICGWHSTRETIRNVFARQAIPMVWDFAETNVLSDSAGNFLGQVSWIEPRSAGPVGRV